MPRKTHKEIMLDAVYYDAALRLFAAESESDEEIHMDLEVAVKAIESEYFGDFINVPKQLIWQNEVLPLYDENRFKQVIRLSYSNFDKIYNLIKDNEVFKTKAYHIPVSVQLAIALYRFGICGTGASLHNIARLFGVGDGSTVVRITRRVIKAILALRKEFVYWPDDNERQKLVEEIYDELPNCIGYIDGTHIKLHAAPKIDKDSYYNKDKNYSIQVQLIIDDNHRIIQFVAGYPGSVHDSRVWRECDIAKNPQRYFSEEQCLVGDKGYALSTQVITPFRINSRAVPARNLKAFNAYLSRYRVRVEHVNGALKQTFGSLKELRIKICNAKGHEHATNWIVACIVLHNIIMPEWDRELEIDAEPDNASTDLLEPRVVTDDAAEQKRMSLYNFIMGKLRLV